ncbi:MAG TPA: PQQ-dependent sugar dehydrogenase, partial [Solirubrobacteraceae bacterium]|nr:PQQ-dependent sugar dehydrogenase [Solirubrobacteraceae bacterium]
GNDQHGTRGNAQDLGTLLGKLLRIDPRPDGATAYTVPADNPFVGRPGARPEIYAYGLRNPWRFSFDGAGGGLWIGDVGQDAVEEIDHLPPSRAAGANLGWRPFEGNRRNFPGESAPGHVRPVITHDRGDGFCSITGGLVVRDRRLRGLYGRYVYGDLCRPEIHTARLRGSRAIARRRLSLRVPQLVSFGQDGAGRVYAVSLEGPVLRLEPSR